MGDFSYSLDGGSSSNTTTTGLFNGITEGEGSSPTSPSSPSRPHTATGVNSNSTTTTFGSLKNSHSPTVVVADAGAGATVYTNEQRQDDDHLLLNGGDTGTRHHAAPAAAPAAAPHSSSYATGYAPTEYEYTMTSRPPGSSGGIIASASLGGNGNGSGQTIEQQQHHHQYINNTIYPTQTAAPPPPGSSAGLNIQHQPPSSSSGIRPTSSAEVAAANSSSSNSNTIGSSTFLAQQQQLYNQQHQQQQDSNNRNNHDDSRTNLWGYSVPSPPPPPQTAQSSSFSFSASGAGAGGEGGEFAFPSSLSASSSNNNNNRQQLLQNMSHHHHLLHHGLGHGGHPADLSISTNAHTMPAPPASAGPSGNPNLHLYQGYNMSNTRPMTAPGSSISAPGYYHSSSYGMFSPETYTGAGFPQSFPRHLNGAHAPVDILHNPPPPGSAGGPPGSSSGPPPGSASSAAAAAAAASILARDKFYGLQGHHYAGLPDEPPGSAGGLAASRYAQMASTSSDNIFAHQPPPLSGGAGPVPPFGAQQQQQHHLQHQHQHQLQQQQAQAASAHYGHYRPGTDYGSRRTLEDLEESRFSRPGTSDTARPDTAYSTYSTHSAYSGVPNTAGLYHHMTHPSLYHMAGQHTMNAMKGPTYNFIPLPSQPKKRPRRRFEEIERLYDCNYPGCNKAYGTLNHLNAHVSMQKHGPKRLPAEFKEIRKAWRQRKKEAEAAAKAGKGKGGSGKKGPVDDDDDDEGDRDELDMDDDDEPHSPEHFVPPGSSSGLPAYAPGAPDLRSGIHHEHQQQPHHHQQHNGYHNNNNSTPPSSNPSFPMTPGYLNNFHGYYPPNISPNSGGYSSRPSTAPGHIMHHLPFGAMANHPGAGLPGGIISPHAGSLPPGYLGARKNSLTSFPPAFDSIQEEGSEETQNQNSMAGGLATSAGHRSGSNGIINKQQGDVSEATSHQTYPGNPHLPTPPILIGGGPMVSTSVTGLGVITHSNNNNYGHSSQLLSAPTHNNGTTTGMGNGNSNNNDNNNGESRPSTASSPFRFTASGLGDTADAYDSLEGRRSSDGHPNPTGAINNFGSNGSLGALSGGGNGIPGHDWKSLSHAASHYPQQQTSR